ncbi:hypothetical protein ACG04R_05355 [Roseateles sp. BYS78W]|uniref:Uncharacterized protein n=1 Tax=Pelomonas candidula TaxID=3299025 RepID=A0ABW7H839_9BURK
MTRPDFFGAASPLNRGLRLHMADMPAGLRSLGVMASNAITIAHAGVSARIS